MKKLFFVCYVAGIIVTLAWQNGKAQSIANNPVATPTLTTKLPFEYQIYLPAIAQEDSASGQERVALLSDGQFVDGPNVGDFDVTRYLTEKQSPLLPYATLFSDKASYYSVNPRVVLALVELLYPHSVMGDSAEAATPFPLDQVALGQLVEELLMSLTEQFYGQLYGRNLALETAGQYQAPRTVTLASGEALAFEFANNAASDAVAVALAKYLPLQRWQQLDRQAVNHSFVATYRRLFPESDPLDNSNRIHPDEIPPEGLLKAAAAPATLLKFPFLAGDTWRFSGGPHAYNGCTDNVFSAIDFAPIGYSGCSDPIAEDRWIAAPAAGTVSAVSCGGCNVAVDHGNGWGTRVYHVVNPQVTKGQQIEADTLLGNPSCAPTGVTCGACGGSSTGVHQHIDLRYNGAFVAIEGTKFEGWTVRGEACYQGYLEKDGVKLAAVSRVTSRPDSVAPTATLTLTGVPGLNEWFRSPLSLTISGKDDRSAINEIQFQIRRSDEISTSAWSSVVAPQTTLIADEDGIYSVTVKVKDSAGNWSPPTALAFQIDGTAPIQPTVVESSCNVVSGQWQNSCADPQFVWDAAADLASGVAGYELQWETATISNSTTIFTTTTQFSPAVVNEGQHFLRMRTFDHAGNQSDWTTVFVFGYDAIAPIGSISLNQGEAIARNALVSITVAISDTLSDVAEIRLRNGQHEWNDWRMVDSAINWPLAGSNGEEVIVEAQVRDQANNLSEVISATIVLNTQPAKAVSTRFQLVRSTIGAASNQGRSAGFVLKGSLGQSSPVGSAQSNQYRLAAGYWRVNLPADILAAPVRTPTSAIPTPPLNCQLSINDGALFTNQHAVQVQLDVTGAQTMKLSPSPLMTREAMLAYTTTASIDLPTPADQIATLTVYGYFGGQNGLLCHGEAVSDTILYDPLSPTIALELVAIELENDTRDDEPLTLNHIRIAAADQNEGSGIADMQLAAEANLSQAEWQPFSEMIPLPLDSWSKLYVRVRDHAGNNSGVVEIVNPAEQRVFLPIVSK